MNTVVERLKPLPNTIEPRWWTGTPALPPEIFTIDCAAYEMGDADLREDGELAQRMRTMFHDVGLVYLINTRLTDLQSMRRFAKLVITADMIYTGGANHIKIGRAHV
jgi:hypothetical protein